MKTTKYFSGRKRIVVVSTFSGMDIFLLACIKSGLLGAFAVDRNFWACIMHRANFFNLDGAPIMAPFVEISEEEYRVSRADAKTEDTVGKFEEKFVRAPVIQDYDGRQVRAEVEKIYGKDTIIIMIGGPVCHDLTGINLRKNKGEGSRNNLMFEYLRFLEEMEPDIALMEQVPELNQKGNEKLYADFLTQARTLPYQFAEQEMCSLHYGGNQARWRFVMMFIHDKYDSQPVFPEPDLVNVKRVRDFLDIDYFHSGHFVDTWKTKNHFMCTVTSSSPSRFAKAKRTYAPSIDDLLLCMDVEKGDYNIPEGTPDTQVKMAIGNAVCLSMGTALIKVILSEILRVKHVGDGFFESLEVPSNEEEEQ
jgi:site-specific DNA-cytosine methylase